MAGIVGVWDRIASRREDSFQKLIARATCGFALESNRHSSGDIICGTALKRVSHPGLIVSRDKAHVLLIQGELLDLGSDPSKHDRFIAGCEKDPVAALDQVDGAYAGALIDLKQNSITLFADQFANYVLHYHQSEDRILFSTQASAIAHVSGASIEAAGLHEYLASWQNFGSRTIFTDVRRLQPGEIVQLAALSSTSRFFARPDYNMASSEASLAELTRSLCNGIQTRIEGKRVAAGLSGGMDTRLVWSGILKLNAHVTAHTHGSKDSRDLMIGKAISRTLKIPSLDLVFDDGFIERSVAKAEHLVAISEGGLRLHECFITDIWESLSAEHDLLLDGHGGALYSRQSMKSVGLKVKTLAELEAAWRPRLLTALIRSDLLRPEIREQALAKLQGSLLAELQKYDGIGGIQDIIDIFNIRDLGWRPSLSGNAQLNYFGMHHPLLTRDLSRLAERVPISKKLRHWVHRAVIKELAPELVNFPVDNDGLPATLPGLPLTRIPPIVYERVLRRFAPKHVAERFTLLRPTNTPAQMLWPQAQRMKLRISELPNEITQLLTPGAQERILAGINRGEESTLLPASLLISAAIRIRLAE